VKLLDDHAVTLALGSDSPRLATARLGMSLVEALAAAGDDVARVAGLAAMQLPAEPQPLAKSMSSAGDLVTALTRHDWTTLDAVARAADAGDASAQQAVAKVRAAAGAQELHAPLQPALAAAHQAATRWLLDRTPRPSNPNPAPPPEPPLIDPDAVTLDLDAANLDDRMLSLAEEIGETLQAHPGRTVRITWRLA
jgi:hypothetical protein